jgi:hypothetical protein
MKYETMNGRWLHSLKQRRFREKRTIGICIGNYFGQYGIFTLLSEILRRMFLLLSGDTNPQPALIYMSKIIDFDIDARTELTRRR